MIVFAPYPLGETRVQREAEALVKHGYEVDVICIRLPDELPIDEYKGVKIYREKYRSPFVMATGSGLGVKFLKYLRFFFAAAIRVTRLHIQKGYSTIQVHNLPDFLVFCTVIPKLFGVPIILDLHDLMPEFYASRFGQNSAFTARFIRLQEKLACRFANHVITVSEHWRQALIDRGVPPHKCSVVMNVADDQIFHPLNGKHLLAHADREFRLIYHGSMHQRYGLDLAIQAIDRVRHEIPNVHLSLVGDGPFIPILHQMIDDFLLEEQVSIIPLRLAEELPELINACDLGIVPYRSDIFTDGLVPTKLMEYAAMGLPAVAARTTTIQAYFSEANVEFFQPDDLDDLTRSILILYRDPDRMTELARRSRNFTDRYNWENIGNFYVSLIDRLGMQNSPYVD